MQENIVINGKMKQAICKKCGTTISYTGCLCKEKCSYCGSKDLKNIKNN